MLIALTSLELSVFGQPARIVADDSDIKLLFHACYSAFVQQANETGLAVIDILVGHRPNGSGWTVTFGDRVELCESIADLIYVVEKTLTIELQRRRQDLFFLHAAAVCRQDRSALIIGESGAGKSTFCWHLSNSGFRYLSDELAPVDLQDMRIEPYPHAICLKSVAAGMPALPAATIDADATLHIPVECIPGGVQATQVAVDSIIFLQKSGPTRAPGLQEMSKSEAAARFYANALNQLAHDNNGLKAASKLADAGACFKMQRGALDSMRQELMQHFDH